VLLREKERQIKDVRKKEIRKALRQVLKKQDVSFQSVKQEQAMHAVLNSQTPLVVVLLTRGSKSLLFTVPAIVKKVGITVVVVPY
jgi:superfamily II DNA helicase RecQ